MVSKSYYLVLPDFEFMWWNSVVRSGEITDSCPYIDRFWEIELFGFEIWPKTKPAEPSSNVRNWMELEMHMMWRFGFKQVYLKFGVFCLKKERKEKKNWKPIMKKLPSVKWLILCLECKMYYHIMQMLTYVAMHNSFNLVK